MTKKDLIAMLEEVYDDAAIQLSFPHPQDEGNLGLDIDADVKSLHTELFAGRNYAILEGRNFIIHGSILALKTTKTNQKITKKDLVRMLENVADDAIIQIRIPNKIYFDDDDDTYCDENAEFLTIEFSASRKYVIIGNNSANY